MGIAQRHADLSIVSAGNRNRFRGYNISGSPTIAMTVIC
jgi:hypothetical protein